MYKSAPHLEEFCRRICSTAELLTADFELILVNDGSPDDSLDIAVRLHQRDQRIIVIDLSRNFGHHKAIMTGLAHARGDRVFLIDSDLEEEPELLPRFWTAYEQQDADVVFGVQSARKGNIFERISGAAFYRLFNWLSNHPVPENLITARLMSQRYVQALLRHRESELFLGGVWAITGFNQVPLVVTKHSHGTSTYSLVHRLRLFVNALTSFSSRPLLLIFYMGAAIFFVSSLAALTLIVARLFFLPFETGWPSLIVSIWMIGGLMIFCLGVIGIYLSKVYTETKRRPYTIIRHIYQRSEEAAEHVVYAHQERRERLLHPEAPHRGTEPPGR